MSNQQLHIKRRELSDLERVCIECGQCCRANSLYVPLTTKDIQQGFPTQYILGSGKEVKTDEQGCLVQDRATGICTAYASRPDYCRMYPADTGVVRTPITGSREYVVLRDRAFREARGTMDYLDYYSTTNLLSPLIFLQKCPLSSAMTPSQRLTSMEEAVSVAKNNLGLFEMVVLTRIFTRRKVRSMQNSGLILGYLIMSDTMYNPESGHFQSIV